MTDRVLVICLDRQLFSLTEFPRLLTQTFRNSRHTLPYGMSLFAPASLQSQNARGPTSAKPRPYPETNGQRHPEAAKKVPSVNCAGASGQSANAMPRHFPFDFAAVSRIGWCVESWRRWCLTVAPGVTALRGLGWWGVPQSESAPAASGAGAQPSGKEAGWAERP